MEVKYDQHFLEDEITLNNIINASNITQDDIILEIGPGKGALTRKILQKNPKKLICVELDISFQNNLELIKEKHSNLEIIFGNALNSIDTFSFNKIIANIPYSITEPLYKKLIENKVEFAVLLHGKTFYDTVIRRESKWHYIIPAFYNLEEIEIVEGNKFTPLAKTKSSVVKLEYKQNPSKFDLFLQELFYKHDRSSKNAIIFALVDSMKISKTQAKQLIKDIEISQIKLENISNDDFVRIIQQLKSQLE